MLATIFRLLPTLALGLFMFATGLRTNRAVLHGLSTHWKLLARALLIVWVVVPLFVLAVLYALRPGPHAAIALMVLAICPGVPLVLRRSGSGLGNRETALLVLIATSLTALVLVPLWAAVLTRFTPLDLRGVTSEAVAKVLLPTVLVPYVLGRIINRLWPRVAQRFAPGAQALFMVAAVLIIAMVVLKRIPDFSDITLRGVLAAVIVTAGSAALGYLSARAAFDDRVSISYAAALGNPALALAVIAQSYDVNALPVVVALVLIRVVTLIPVTWWFKHHRVGPRPQPGPPALATGSPA